MSPAHPGRWMAWFHDTPRVVWLPVLITLSTFVLDMFTPLGWPMACSMCWR